MNPQRRKSRELCTCGGIHDGRRLRTAASSKSHRIIFGFFGQLHLRLLRPERRCISGTGRPKESVEAASARKLAWLVRRCLSNPVTAEVAWQLRTGPHETWNSAGGRVGADSASRWPFIELQGLAKEAPKKGWGGTMTQLRDWAICNPADLPEARWDFTDYVPRSAERRKLALQLWLAATVKEPNAPDMCRWELAVAQPNPQNVSEVAHMLVGCSVGGTNKGEASLEALRDVGIHWDGATAGGPRSKMARRAAKA